jgi:hypothetical protein
MDIGSSGISRRGFVKGATAGIGLTALAGTAAADLLPSSASRTVGADDVLRMARVWVTSREEGALLSLFDDTHHVFDDGSYEVLLWPGDLARLKASGLRFDITVEDVVSRDRTVQARADQQTSFAGRVPGENPGGYRTLEQVNADLMALVSRFKGDARLITLPLRTREGRTVYGIEIAKDVEKVDGRPVWYMDGVHHAREWPSGENTIMFAFELLENPQKDPRVTALFEGTRTILVPVVNADGFSWTRLHGTTSSNSVLSLPLIVAGQADYWRKNRYSPVEQAVVPVVQRNPLAVGVDINRNYSARWGGGGAGSTPDSQTYRGPAVFSEPEIRNVAGLLRERQPIAVNSNHTYTGLVLRPWGYSGGSARYSPDEDLMRDLGAKMCQANGYRNIHSFDLYVTTGTMTDWAYAAIGALSYCFEIGFSNFHPDYAGPDGPVHHYGINREGFLLLGEAALYQQVEYKSVPVVNKSNPNQHVTTTQRTTVTHATHAVIAGTVVDATGAAVPADLQVARTTRIPLGAGGGNGLYEEASKAVSATDATGAFSWHLPPSTTPVAKEKGETEAWTLTATTKDGRTTSTSVVVDRGETKTVTLKV